MAWNMLDFIYERRKYFFSEGVINIIVKRKTVSVFPNIFAFYLLKASLKRRSEMAKSQNRVIICLINHVFLFERFLSFAHNFFEGNCFSPCHI